MWRKLNVKNDDTTLWSHTCDSYRLFHHIWFKTAWIWANMARKFTVFAFGNNKSSQPSVKKYFTACKHTEIYELSRLKNAVWSKDEC
jgi:hypothetical protein